MFLSSVMMWAFGLKISVECEDRYKCVILLLDKVAFCESQGCWLLGSLMCSVNLDVRSSRNARVASLFFWVIPVEWTSSLTREV